MLIVSLEYAMMCMSMSTCLYVYVVHMYKFVGRTDTIIIILFIIIGVTLALIKDLIYIYVAERFHLPFYVVSRIRAPCACI